MAATKFDLRETVIEAWYGAREVVEGFVSDFSSRDRFFKYKVGIVGVWALLSLTTLGVACPSQGGANRLGARVRPEKVVDQYSILVRNESDVKWDDVRITVNNRYTAYTSHIAPGDHITLTLWQFTGDSGQVPPKGMQPQIIAIRCAQGTYERDLSVPEEP
jgi:hypothetical protein